LQSLCQRIEKSADAISGKFHYQNINQFQYVKDNIPHLDLLCGDTFFRKHRGTIGKFFRLWVIFSVSTGKTDYTI